MPIILSDILMKGSNHSAGGKNNLGGTKANTLTSQTCSAPAIVTGVTIVSAVGNPAGVGQMTYNPTDQLLSWQPPNAQTPLGVIITGNGTYLLGGSAGALSVAVVSASLPSVYKVESLIISTTVNAVFDDVSPSMALVGAVQYRCIYIHNANASLAIIDAKLFVGSQPSGPNTIAIGLDPAGVGDGATTGVATTIVDENTAPAGVSFTAPTTASGGITVPNIPAGESIAVWQRRTVPVNSFGDIALTSVSLGLALLG